MFSTPNKRQPNRRLLSHLHNFGQDIIIGNAASDRQDKIMVNEGTGDQKFIVGTSEKI